jgi:hypothetical protein
VYIRALIAGKAYRETVIFTMLANYFKVDMISQG